MGNLFGIKKYNWVHSSLFINYTQYKNNKKNGTEKYYGIDGNIVYEAEFLDDNAIKETGYYPNGNIKYEVDYNSESGHCLTEDNKKISLTTEQISFLKNNSLNFICE